MDLAIEFGEPNVDRLIERLDNDSSRLAKWRAYYEISPFGYRRHNMHAILGAMAHLKPGADPTRLMFDDDSAGLDQVYEQYKEEKARRAAEAAELEEL